MAGIAIIMLLLPESGRLPNGSYGSRDLGDAKAGAATDPRTGLMGFDRALSKMLLLVIPENIGFGNVGRRLVIMYAKLLFRPMITKSGS
jgi:hypothetical protein